MKKFRVIVVTVIITWIVVSLVHGIRTGADRLWLISAVKVPGRMALGDIQADMSAGRYELAKAKIDVFVDRWQRFNNGRDSFRGPGIGDIMVAFSMLGTNGITAHPDQGGATNGSHL